jgi:hypothetical protein
MSPQSRRHMSHSRPSVVATSDVAMHQQHAMQGMPRHSERG